MKSVPTPDSHDVDEQAVAWAAMLQDGFIDPVDREAFDRWLNVPSNAAAFKRLAGIWSDLGTIAHEPEIVTMRAAALESLRASNSRRWQHRRSWPMMSAFAVALAALLIVSSVWTWNSPVSIDTGIGERRSAMLTDGSRVTLDADTQVRANMHNDHRRLTLLQGRARFDVAHDPLRPFTVTAGGRTIVATGTSFSVELIERQLHVLLYEGHVSILGGSSNEDVRQTMALPAGRDQSLVAGRQFSVSTDATGPGRVEPFDTKRSTAWESGELVFDDESLAVAISRLNRYLDRPLRVTRAAAGRRITGVFTPENIDGFIEGAAAVNDLTIVRTPAGIVLDAR